MELLPHDDRVLGGRSVACAVLRREPPDAAGRWPLRVLYPADDLFARDLAFVAACAARVETAALSPEVDYHVHARELIEEPVQPGGKRARVFDDFTRDVPCFTIDVAVEPAQAPGDFGSNHPDFAELFLTIDPASGSADVYPRLPGTPTERARARLRKVEQDGGVDVPGAVVLAHRGLYDAGEDDLPARVLVSFHRDADDGYLRELARYIGTLKGTSPQGRMKRDLAKLVDDERAVRYRRKELPLAATDGVPVYACDVWVHRPFLRKTCLSNRIVPCLAVRGLKGACEVLPHDGSF
jgi:hypothetical protein